jgi:hypothetical protein
MLRKEESRREGNAKDTCYLASSVDGGGARVVHSGVVGAAGHDVWGRVESRDVWGHDGEGHDGADPACAANIGDRDAQAARKDDKETSAQGVVNGVVVALDSLRE